jgi:photosystem II stability/assembly factor-like uncharacterized protein
MRARHAWPLVLTGLFILLAISVMPGDDAGPPAKHHSQIPGDGLVPKAPNPWFFAERAYPLGKIPRDEWREAQLQATAIRAEAGDRDQALWQQEGPSNIGGRVTCMAVDPRNDNVVYAGAAEGGVLRSDDAGQNWIPLFDHMPSLSVGAMVLDPSDADRIYVGTGEVNPGGGSVAYGGTGLYRSDDQGANWISLGLEDSGSIARIVVDPSNPDRIFVAVNGHHWTTSQERGVYRSEDGGDSWERVLFTADDTGCIDIVQRADNPNVLVAAMWQHLRQPTAYSYGGSNCAVYRSTDGGDNWSQLGGGLPSPTSQSGRIGLAICQSQPQYICAVYADKTGYFDGLYRSSDGGASWTQTNDGSLSGVFASYGWWFGNVRVHPENPDVIFVLGLWFARSTNGGASYSDASGSMHVDHHGMAFGSGTSPVMYEGNDGGVYRSTNSGTSWSKGPNLPISQIYKLALDANNSDALLAGLQDNGTCRTNTGALDDWSMIYGGDGFQPLVHPENSSRIWAMYQYGGLGYSSNGGGSFSGATSGLSGRYAWSCPLVQDPNNADQRYFGTDKVHRSTSNTSWTAISGDLTGGTSGGSGQVRGTLISIAVSPIDGEVIWSGSDDGVVSVTQNGGTSWSDVSTTLPDRWITSVSCDPNDREIAYVTLSGFRWAEDMAHVYRTDNLGATWTAIDGNLPDAPANDLIADPDNAGRYFVATDLGVYVSENGGGNWSVLGAGLPNVVINQMRLDQVNRRLYAGSYGRSIWSIDIDQVTTVDAPPEFLRGRMLPVYPNPSAGGTWIAWELERAMDIQVELFTVAGRKVWSKRVEANSAGAGRVFWNACDRHGNPLASGLYLARVRSGAKVLGSKTVTLHR